MSYESCTESAITTINNHLESKKAGAGTPAFH